MTTMIQHEQDVFAPLATLQETIADMDAASSRFDKKHAANAGLKHHRDAARHRVHRLRAIDSIRRPRAG